MEGGFISLCGMFDFARISAAFSTDGWQVVETLRGMQKC
jgi:hypothetical protein